jgi:hypothetical protein
MTLTFIYNLIYILKNPCPASIIFSGSATDWECYADEQKAYLDHHDLKHYE